MTGAHPAEHPDHRNDNRPAAHRWPVNASGTASGEVQDDSGVTSARFVVHVPLVAPDLTAALRLARVLAHRSATLPGLDAGGTSVSDDGDGVSDHRAFCDQTLSRRHRCRLTAHHQGPCRP